MFLGNQQAFAGHAQQQKQQDPLGVMYFVLTVMAMCWTPFCRKAFGKEGLRPAALSLLVIFVVALVAREAAMWVYLIAWIVAVCRRRRETFKLLAEGVRIHSRSPGYPEAAMRTKGVKSMKTALLVVEPLMCFILGGSLWFTGMQPITGQFMCACGVALVMVGVMDQRLDNLRTMSIEDAQIEMDYYAKRARGEDVDW
jgi:hypothetical protein